MKKRLVAAMFTVMMISLVGCGKASEPMPIEATEVVEESETVEATETTETVEEATETEAPAEEPAAEEPVAEEPSSPYSYTELSQTMYAQSTVNVRDLPEQSGAKLGSLLTNQEVTVTGQCNETGWYRISYNGGEGFVSNSYLGAEKVAVKSSQNTAKSSEATQAPAETPAEAPAAQPEAPAQSDQPYEVDENGVVWKTDGPIEPGETLTPNVQPGTTCGWCGAVLNSYEEALEHAETVHGLQ